MSLNPEQFNNWDDPLPGMSGKGLSPTDPLRRTFRQAMPWEQTEAQFNNRPDVMVHGRYVNTADPEKYWPAYTTHVFQGLHAGTRQAAHDRLKNLGAPYHGYEARFYHGQVDPTQMKNSPDPGEWEKDDSEPAPTDPGRIKDVGEEWDRSDLNKYYRNDFEDPGSTSAILSTSDTRLPIGHRTGIPGHQVSVHASLNFKSWRQHVAQALGQWPPDRSTDPVMPVPAHVRALYEATEGVNGVHSTADTTFKPPHRAVLNDEGRLDPADLYGDEDEPLSTSMTRGSLQLGNLISEQMKAVQPPF